MDLNPDMKATLALDLSLVVFLVVGIAATLATGPVDFYAAISLVFAIPYLLFVYFGWKGRAWAYLGSSVLSAALIVVTATTLQGGMSDILLWETMFATLL